MQKDPITICTEFKEVIVHCHGEMCVKDIITESVDQMCPALSSPVMCECFTLHVKLRTSDDYTGSGFLCPYLTWSDMKKSYRSTSFDLCLKVYWNTTTSLLQVSQDVVAKLRDYELRQARKKYLHTLSLMVLFDHKTALNLGTLEIMALHEEEKKCKDVKSFLDYLEKMKRLNLYFPQNLTEIMKTKQLKKEVMSIVNRLAGDDLASVHLESLQQAIAYKTEVVPCEVGTGFGLPVQMLIGPLCQVSIRTDSKVEGKILAYFASVVSVRCRRLALGQNSKSSNSSGGTVRHQVCLYLKESPDPITLTFHSQETADFAAHVIDRYSRLQTNRFDTPLLDWGCPFRPTKQQDQCETTLQEIEPSQVRMELVIGNGQFGDVYRGVYVPENIKVAVKTCKPGTKPEDEQEFLREAEIMKELRSHPHIVRLIGLMTRSTVSIVMEHATLGELRSYLTVNQHTLQLSTLLAFCYQLCTALAYLESERIIHRDIAARNVLVFTDECVKLSDFGMAKRLKPKEDVYLCPKGKLPIKWIAPESYQARKFSLSSDVWMFGVCIWEIFSLGVKPWSHLNNEQVKSVVDNGERLAMPRLCPSLLYQGLLKCWSADPASRPSFSLLQTFLNDVKVEGQRQMPANVPRPSYPAPPVTSIPDVPSPVANNNVPPRKPSYPSHLFNTLQHRGSSPSSSSSSSHHPSSGSFSEFNNQSLPNLFQERANATAGGMTPSASCHNTMSQVPPIAPRHRQDGEKDALEKHRAASVDRLAECPAVAPIGRPSRLADAALVLKSCFAILESVEELNKRVYEVPPGEYKIYVKNIGQALLAMLQTIQNNSDTISEGHEIAVAVRQLTEDMQHLVKSAQVAHQFIQVPLLADFQQRLLADARTLAVDVKTFYDKYETHHNALVSGNRK